MLLLANKTKNKRMQKPWEMTETLAYGHSSESTSTQRELSNEYQHANVYMVFKIVVSLCFGWK